MCPTAWGFCSRILFSLSKKINTSCRICILFLTLSIALTSTVVQKAEEKCLELQLSKEVRTPFVASWLNQTSEVAVVRPFQLSSAGGQWCWGTRKTPFFLCWEVHFNLVSCSFIKPGFLHHTLTVLCTGPRKHCSKFAVECAMDRPYSWTHVKNSKYSLVYIKKNKKLSQHHGFLRSESLLCIQVSINPAFDLVRTVDSDPWVWFCLVSALLEMVSSVNTLVYWWCNTQWKHGTTHSDSPCFLLKLHSWTNYGSKLSMFAWFRHVLFTYSVCVSTNPLSFRKLTGFGRSI